MALGQSFAGYLMLALVFMWSGGLRSATKSLVVRQLVRLHVYTMFISSNCASFHLWWKKNLVKRKISKYYKNDCSCSLGQKLLLLLSIILKTLSSAVLHCRINKLVRPINIKVRYFWWQKSHLGGDVTFAFWLVHKCLNQALLEIQYILQLQTHRSQCN